METEQPLEPAAVSAPPSLPATMLLARQRADEEGRRTEAPQGDRSRELERALAIERATLAATTDAILVADNEGRVLEFNQRYADVLRVPVAVLEEGVAATVREFASRNFASPEGFVGRTRQIMESRDDSFDVLECMDGRILERISKVLRIEGEAIGRVWSVRDVSDRHAAEITSRRLAAIVTSSDDAIIGKDLHSVVTSWNAGAERIFGYTAAEMVGTSIMRLIPPERQQEELEILTRIQRGERFEHFETVRVRKDGRRIQLSITVSPIKDSTDQVIGASKIARDITASKEATVALGEAMERAEMLSREREQLLESERDARSRAERASRMKDEFLATLSHELRTPLNAVLGWVNILRTEKCDGADLEEGLVVIERNARAQTQIIEDLLDMSRIISGKVRLEAQRMDLPTVLVESIDTMRATAAAKGVRLVAEMDLKTGAITGDPHRMQQVFWNLLSNAIKFTPRDGEVRVGLAREDADIVVTVADTGEGIAPEFLPQVFDRFQQADSSTTRRHGGLGLGLAIVRQLVEMHGGGISARSEGRGHGAEFTVRLPLISGGAEPKGADATTSGSASDPRPEHLPMAEISLAGTHVLVVDDEADAREFVKRLLQRVGATVSMAGSADEAMAVLKAGMPNVLVCDIGMPGEDGFSLIRRVRALEGADARGLPAVALTAYARSEDRTKAIRMGFQNHLSKPVDAAELLAVVASLGRGS